MLREIGEASVKAFRAGSNSAGGGPVNEKSGNDASKPGQFPAIQSGKLISSLEYQVSGDKLEVGTKAFYAIYLRGGTRKMARRKMSQDALRAGMAAHRSTKRAWAKWEYGAP